VNVVESLAAGGVVSSGTSGATQQRSRVLLATVQVAFATALLVGAGLLIRNFVGLLTADLGYDPSGTLKARVEFVRDMRGREQTELLQTVLNRLSRTPGVVSAALATDVPLDSEDKQRVWMISPTDGAPAVEVRAADRVVSTAYFATVHTRVVQGRAFAEPDLVRPDEVVVVNRTFARKYLGDRAVGRRIPLGFVGRLVEVIGVVDDVRQRDVAEAPAAAFYELYRQPPGGSRAFFQMTILARTTGDPMAMAPRLRALLHQADSTLVVDHVETLADLQARNLVRPRLYSALVGTLAACATAMAGIGLFAVLAFGVAQRAREISIRATLGARPGDIVRLVVGEALGVALAGAGIGVLLALGLVRYLATLLYGMTAYDPAIFTTVPVIVLAVLTVACWMPARQAARIDPIRVLRG
jgi:predicted permease